MKSIVDFDCSLNMVYLNIMQCVLHCSVEDGYLNTVHCLSMPFVYVECIVHDVGLYTIYAIPVSYPAAISCTLLSLSEQRQSIAISFSCP